LLPAYLCQSLHDGALAGGCEIVWYSVDERLEPDFGELTPGDMVLVIDYFGRPPSQAVRTLIQSRRDVIWIEDRAQALDTAAPQACDNVVYSPRKLVGVGDGGILVTGGEIPYADQLPDEDFLWAPNDLRSADPDGLDPSAWRTAFLAREAAFEPDTHAMSWRTYLSLLCFDWRPEAAARRANWALLARGLSDLALWPDREVDFAPLAYPILADDAGALAAHLAAQRIWAPRHWASLPSPARFTDAHALSRRCLSLPLDGRYGADDMTRIIEAVQSYPR
jgi:hypothetical protein